MRLARMLPVCLLLSCGEKEDTASRDTAPQQVEEHEDSSGCQAVTLDILGPEDPVVGDSWTVWLHCDEALLTGVTVLSFAPPEFATVDENVATFLYAGEATMRMQVGAYWQEQDVTVGEPL